MSVRNNIGEECHTCHMTEPISLGELIRTHPLRSNGRRHQHGIPAAPPLPAVRSSRSPGRATEDAVQSTLSCSPPPLPNIPLPPRNRSLQNETSKSGDYASQNKKMKHTSSSFTARKAIQSEREFDLLDLDPVESFLHNPRLQHIIQQNDSSNIQNAAEPQYTELKRSKRIKALVGKIDQKLQNYKCDHEKSQLMDYSIPSSSDDSLIINLPSTSHKERTPRTPPSYCTETFIDCEQNIKPSQFKFHPTHHQGHVTSLSSHGICASVYSNCKNSVHSESFVKAHKKSIDAEVQTYDVVSHPSQAASSKAGAAKKASPFLFATTFFTNKRVFSCGFCPQMPVGFLIAGYALLVRCILYVCMCMYNGRQEVLFTHVLLKTSVIYLAPIFWGGGSFFSS